MSPALAGGFFTTVSPGRPIMTIKEPLKEQAWFPQAAVSVGEGEDSRHFLNKVGGQLKVKQGIVLGFC